VKVACFSLLALCTLALPAQDRPAPAAAEHDGTGALAILRRDGVMFPFASFERNRWRVTWPISLQAIELPVSIDAIPERWWGTPTPDKWRAHLLNGETVALQPRVPIIFRSFCGRRLGLRTSYKSAQPPPPVPAGPFPKDGVAVSGNVALEPIEHVDRTSAEWTALAVSLLKDFNRVEEETLRRVRLNTAWQHSVKTAERNKVPVRLEAWYRSPSGEPGWTVSYIEAVRTYPPGPEDNGCGLETLVSGWLHHQNGELKKSSDLRGKITYCDRVGATFMLPFGRIRPTDRTYWIFQLSGWDDEWYEVAEIGPEKVRHVVEVYAGGRLGCR
jgi:hypothetical protein